MSRRISWVGAVVRETVSTAKVGAAAAMAVEAMMVEAMVAAAMAVEKAVERAVAMVEV